MTGDEWMLAAKCRGSDPEVFFPNGHAGPSSRHDIDAARAVCAGCAVLMDCLRYAVIDHPQGYGVWAGTTEEERRAIRRSPNRMAALKRQLAAVGGAA